MFAKVTLSAMVISTALAASADRPAAADDQEAMERVFRHRKPEDFRWIDPRTQPQMYIDRNGVRTMTPEQHEKYEAEQRAREEDFKRVNERIEQQARAAHKEAGEKLTGYAIAFALAGIVTAFRCRSGAGAVVVLLLFLGLAAVTYSVASTPYRTHVDTYGSGY